MPQGHLDEDQFDEDQPWAGRPSGQMMPWFPNAPTRPEVIMNQGANIHGLMAGNLIAAHQNFPNMIAGIGPAIGKQLNTNAERILAIKMANQRANLVKYIVDSMSGGGGFGGGGSGGRASYTGGSGSQLNLGPGGGYGAAGGYARALPKGRINRARIAASRGGGGGGGMGRNASVLNEIAQMSGAQAAGQGSNEMFRNIMGRNAKLGLGVAGHHADQERQLAGLIGRWGVMQGQNQMNRMANLSRVLPQIMG